MTDMTARLALPLLAAGQAQKELTHNEALTAIDLLVQASVEAVGIDAPPPAPADGQSWIVGTAPTGAWTGQAGALASWTDAGWRFAAPRPGMAAWSLADAAEARRTPAGWEVGSVAGRRLVIDGRRVVGPRRAPIATPVGGSVTDAEGRVAIAAILAALRGHGLIDE